MERQIPKNVRQIGNVSGSPKIYVEDYVDTFFAQLSEKCEAAGEEPMGAFLIGEIQNKQEEQYVYIYGAVQMKELKMNGKDYVINDDSWKQAFEDSKEYFDGGELIGWFVVQQGIPILPEPGVLKLHKKSFPKENTVFIMKDPVEKEETYYVHKMNDLLESGGHYTYYEKNPCMQSYMISSRKKNGAASPETVEDRAAKDFRNMVRKREEHKKGKVPGNLMYVAGACVVVVMIVMGVSMMNNFDRMRSVQNTLAVLAKDRTEGPEERKIDQKKEKDGESDQKAAALKKDSLKNADKQEMDKQEMNKQDVEKQEMNKQEVDGHKRAALKADEQGNNKEAEVFQDATSQDKTSQDKTFQKREQTGSEKYTVTEEKMEDGSVLEESRKTGIYVVEKGDTLAIISRKVYGDFEHVDPLRKMNGISDENLIYIGQKLLLP